MSTNKTENYQLSQWAKSDQVLMEDFNADNAKIDAALKAEANARAALAQSRNCQVYYTTYVGTGTSGESGCSHLTFPRKPFLVHVEGDRAQAFSAIWGNPYAVENHTSADPSVLTLSWGEKTLSWFGGMGAGRQLNEKGKTYYVLAILELED